MSRAQQPEMDPTLADAVRRACEQPVGPQTAQRHMAAILAEAAGAQGAAASRERPAGRRLAPRRAWRPALSLLAAVLALPAGLAAAGVSLPEAVDTPYSAVGVHLPNQGGDAAAPRTTAQPPAPATTTSAPATAPAPAAPRARRHGSAAATPRPARTTTKPGHKPRGAAGSGSRKSATPATGVHGHTVIRSHKPAPAPAAPAAPRTHAPRRAAARRSAPKRQRSSRPAHGGTAADGSAAPSLAAPQPPAAAPQDAPATGTGG